MQENNEDVCCSRCGCHDVEVTREPSERITDYGPWVTPGAGRCNSNQCGQEFTFTYTRQGENLHTRPARFS